MEEQKLYKFSLDGVATPETYPSLEKAMEAAKLYFAANHNKENARFYTLELRDLNVMIRNKHYVEPLITV